MAVAVAMRVILVRYAIHLLAANHHTLMAPHLKRAKNGLPVGDSGVGSCKKTSLLMTS